MLPEFQGERIIPGEPMVMVEYVGKQPTKDDCRNYTKIIWVGAGDVKPYPKRLWPKLLAHPDVWRLAEDQSVPAYMQQTLQPAAPLAAPGAPAGDSPEVAALKQQLAEANAKLAAVNGDAPLPMLTEEDLAAMSDEEVHAAGKARKLGLQPRLVPEKLRPYFLELQAAKG